MRGTPVDNGRGEFQAHGTWWHRTGQRWKQTLLLGSVIVLLAVRWVVRDAPWADLMPLASGLPFAWFLQAVRCPACGARVAWHIVRRRPFGEFIRMAEMQSCPACGDGGHGQGAQ